MPSLPSHARVVIIGGGVVGCSLAYHLSLLGWQDIVLLERKQLACGTTWHAAGLLGQLRATANMTKLAQYTTNLYTQLEAETGQATGVKQNGSLGVARDLERLEELKRGASMASVFGLEVDVVSPSEIKQLYPLIETKDIVGGVYLPKDGQCNPADVTQALAKGARSRGAQVVEGVKVTAIHQKDGKVTGVTAQQEGGDPVEIKAEHVVNCAGMWGRQVGKMAGVDVPLQACEHFYIVTEPHPDIPRDMPVLRDPGGCAYYKEDAGKILLGAFEPVSKPWGMQGIPEDFCFDELPYDFDHFEPILETACELVPLFNNIGVHTFFNGPESFTPDDRYLLGEAPFLRNYWVACGFNSIGIQSAGGAGKVLSEWMEAGVPPFDVGDVDIRRIQPWQSNQSYVVERATEALGLLYAMHWPYRQVETSRHLRRSPVHQRLEEANACFGEVAGWERPNWFAPKGVEAKYDYSFKRQNWFPYAAEEHQAVRTAAGMFDISSFAKFRVEGRDAEAVLQRISANDVAVAPGKLVYTQWLNQKGGIESDLTITRLSDNAFMVVTAPAQATRDLSWLLRHVPSEAHCVVTDVTAAEAILAVMGPNSRAILQSLTDSDLSNGAFPFGTWQTIDLGMARIRAQRISYVGELGWELYIPAEFAVHVWDTIMQAGAAHGLRPCGMHVLDSCRIEKAYRHYGHDITDEDTPLEAGLGFAVKLQKAEGTYGPFNGRDALIAQKEQGLLTKRLLQFKLHDPEPLLYHNEPIWRNGDMVGYLSSGNYGHYLGGAIGMGYVSHAEGVSADFVNTGEWELEIACERFSADASLRPMYDPKSERMRV